MFSLVYCWLLNWTVMCLQPGLGNGIQLFGLYSKIHKFDQQRSVFRSTDQSHFSVAAHCVYKYYYQKGCFWAVVISKCLTMSIENKSIARHVFFYMKKIPWIQITVCYYYVFNKTPSISFKYILTKIY